MGTAGKAPEEALSWNDGDCYEVSFGVGKSRRYHAYMREFYVRCDTWTSALTVIAGSASFVSLLPDDPNVWLTRGLAAVVTIASSFKLVFGFSKKADRHDELCRRFTLLAADMAEWEPTLKNHKRACAERIRIEAAEPTERRLIDLWAHNDELQARGVLQARLLPLSKLQYSFLAYIFDFGLATLRSRIAKRDAAGSTEAEG